MLIPCKFGVASSRCATRQRFGLTEPSLGDIKDACVCGDAGRLRAWLIECREAAMVRLLDTNATVNP